MSTLVRVLVFASIALLAVPRAQACPKVRGLIDFNCDRTEKYVFVGDSIVRGVGDSVRHNNGGYVARVRHLVPISTAVNLGVPGITSFNLLKTLKQTLQKPNGSTTLKSKNSDVYVVAVGVNDCYPSLGQKQDPGLTVRNIKRIVKQIRQGVGQYSNSPPFVAVALLTPSTRIFQQPCIEEVNSLLLRYRSRAIPAYLTFNELAPINLSGDGLHPNSEGYTALASIASNYFIGEAQEQMSAERADRDKDGVYDYFENKLFSTNPRKADSDDDGVMDGKEIFSLKTDPLNPDTDGDGVSDGDEVIAGTDPLKP